MTPTNSSLGSVEAERISKNDAPGNHISGDKPSKVVFLHQAFYETRADDNAVVHSHLTWATVGCCLSGTGPDDYIPPLKPYVVMRVGRVKLLPNVKPGDPREGDTIRHLGGDYSAALLAIHGPVVSGTDLFSAVCAAEELEETAKLVVDLRGKKTRLLTEAQVA